MLKYLDKIKVFSETASNGQECLEMVFSKEPGYYSLIIVSLTLDVVADILYTETNLYDLDSVISRCL